MPRRRIISGRFKEQLEHLCDIGLYTRAAGDYGSGGHGGSWDDEEAEDVACLLYPVRGTEEVTLSTGVVQLTHRIVMQYRSDLGAHSASALYRIVNVRDVAGTVIEAGPLNIVFVKDPGGQHHHLELSLTRQRIPT